MGKADRIWWRSFAKWLATTVAAATVFGLAVASCIDFDARLGRQLAERESSAEKNMSRSERLREATLDVFLSGVDDPAKLVILFFGITFELFALVIVIWCWTQDTEPTPPRKTAIPSDATFRHAAWASTTKRPANSPPAQPSLDEHDEPSQVLGVRPDAPQSEIRRAFRKLILIHHPDRGGEASTAKTIIQAYQALKDRRAI